MNPKRTIIFICFFLICKVGLLNAQHPELIFDNSQNESGAMYDFIVFNNKLYFSCHDDIHGLELWEYDGSNLPTMVLDIGYDCDGKAFSKCVYKDKLYFQANDGLYGFGLWEYDGINDPKSIRHIIPGSNSSTFAITVFNDKLLLSFPIGDNKSELWEYDGNSTPQMIETIPCEINLSPLPNNFVIAQNTLYFTGEDDSYYSHLFKFDGNNTSYVKDDQNNKISPSCMVEFNNNLFYFLWPRGLYEYDGVNPPSLVIDIDLQSGFYGMFVYNNKLYFSATDGITGNELWEYNGTDPPAMVYDINPSDASSPRYFVEYNDKMFFNAYDETEDDLWVYDGNNPPYKAFENDSNYSNAGPKNLTVFYHKLYFTSFDFEGYKLWSYSEYEVPVYSDLSCKIYPNPTHDKFMVEIVSTKTEILSFELVNIHGQLIFRKEFNSIYNKEFNFDISGYDAGIYFVSIKSENQVMTEKLIKY